MDSKSGIDIISTTDEINNQDVVSEITACLDIYADDQDDKKATVRLLAVIAGSLQRIAERLEAVQDAIDGK